MNNTLYVITDASGSMYEMSKMSISMNILSFVRECTSLYSNTIYFNNINVLKWNDTVEIIELNENKEFENFMATGKLNFTSLKDRLTKISEKNTFVKIILLSDGNYNNFELDDFIEWNSTYKNLHIAAVAIGVDASFDKLKKISYNKNVYNPEDILSAIKSLECITNNNIGKITSIDEVIHMTANNDLDD